MNRQIIRQGGKPAFVVIPINEWRRIEATSEDRLDARALREFRESRTETFPDAVVATILEGAYPLRVFREYRGLTQAELAKAAGTSAVYISQLERGVRSIGRKLRARLAGVLKIDPDLLECDRDRMRPA